MKKELDTIIERFRNSQTSLESYQAISDFVKIIIEVPEFIAHVEKEGELIRKEKIRLNNDNGHGLSWSALKEHNKRRDIKGETLFQLDPVSPLRNLMSVNFGIQPENIVENSIWLFKRFTAGEPLPEADRKEYQGFIDMLHKIILPFLKEVSADEIIETKGVEFNVEKGILYIGSHAIKLSSTNEPIKGQAILKYIFESDEALDYEHSFSDIARDVFEYDHKDPKSSKKCLNYCIYINKIIRETTKIEDFLVLSSGITGTVRINKKYLE